MMDASANTSHPSNASSNMSFSLSEATQHLDFWRTFDLDNRRLLLDKSCIEMKEMKSNSITARKRLNEVTKSFRVKNKEEQMTMINDILRDYQEEIDQLSRRSKYSENAFYGIYKALYDAPDPVDIISQMIHVITSSSTNQLEIERLRAELIQYDEEFQQLKNQDITIRRLEEQLQEFRDNIEEKVAEAVKVKAQEAEELADTRVAEIREVQKASERRLSAALESLRQAQASADRAQSQLFEVSSQAESRISGLQAENSILAEGTHRNNLRVAELERSLELLQSNHSAWKSSASQSLSQAENDADDSRALQQMLVSDLRAESQRKDDLLRIERSKNESMLRDVSNQLNKEREAVSRMRQELAERPAVDDFLALKQQLKVMQRLVFNIQDEAEDDASHPELTQLSLSADSKVQFEMMLTMKLKSLEADLTETRRSLLESREQEKLATSTAHSLQASLEASTALIRRLESDLEMRTGKHQQHGRSSLNMSTSTSDPSQGLAELLADAPITNNKSLTQLSSSSLAGNDGQQQLVTILQAQRDRYKDRLAQVESSLLCTQQQLETITTAKGQLEADNLSLYSKIRFLQSYPQHPHKQLPSSMMMNNSRGVKGMHLRSSSNHGGHDEEYGYGSSDQQQDVEQRYQQLYEQGISPFQEFSRFEKQRKLNELSVADRIVLNTTMAVVSSHTGRNFLLVYLALMHLLVFATLYYSAHYVHYGCDPTIDHLIHQHQKELIENSAAVASNTAVNIAAVAMKNMRW